MKSLRMSIFPLMVLATGVTAEEYKSITTLNYSDLEYSYHDHYYSPMGWPYPTSGYGVWERKVKTSTVGTTYFFGGKETLGPLKEFEYINKVNNISAHFTRLEDSADYWWRKDNHQNSFSTKGEYFAENGVVLSTEVLNQRDKDVYSQSVGYLFTPNLLVKLNYSDFEYDIKYKTFSVDEEFPSWTSRHFKFDEEEFSLTAQYNHQLSDTGYLGFTVNVGEETDDHTLSSKYFVDFGNDKYLSVEAKYYHGNGRAWDNVSELNASGLNAEFYFNKETSINIAYDENHRYKLGFSHFFNRNIAIDVAYLAAATNKYNGYYEDYGCDDCDAYRYDEYRLGLRVQL
ncbi:putative porin [Microbulbifer variabilis]|uniref:putative porin n=1 Tax=Microbulbifer variabilis TaxID=266805 RepID=UPI001CFD2D5A|nr:putative porin [Microbulbifer variabilis]